MTIDSTNLEHGVHHATLRFQADNDPYLESIDVPVDLTVNRKPIAVPTGATVECTGINAASATLDGSGSSDPDGDPITYLWSAPGITFDDPTSVTPTAIFPVLGDTTVTLVVNDGYENSDAATVIVRVQDRLPPTIVSVGATPTYLWPPNHNMSTVTTTVIATGVCVLTPSKARCNIPNRLQFCLTRYMITGFHLPPIFPMVKVTGQNASETVRRGLATAVFFMFNLRSQ